MCVCAYVHTGVGLNVFELTLSLQHGLIEFAAMVITFVLVGRSLTGRWSKPFGAYGWMEMDGWMDG